MRRGQVWEEAGVRLLPVIDGGRITPDSSGTGGQVSGRYRGHPVALNVVPADLEYNTPAGLRIEFMSWDWTQLTREQRTVATGVTRQEWRKPSIPLGDWQADRGVQAVLEALAGGLSAYREPPRLTHVAFQRITLWAPGPTSPPQADVTLMLDALCELVGLVARAYPSLA